MRHLLSKYHQRVITHGNPYLFVDLSTDLSPTTSYFMLLFAFVTKKAC